MFRQFLGYLPATVIPAVVSFVMIYAYTRLMTPDEYGAFSLLFSAVLVVQTSFFFAVPMALSRFYPEAAEQGRIPAFLAECYTLFYALGTAVIGALAICLPVVHVPVIWVLGTALLLARSAIGLGQSVRRMAGQMRRYNLTECAHAVTGLALGVLFLLLFHGDAAFAVMAGLLIAAIPWLVLDCRLLLLPVTHGHRTLDRANLRRLARYIAPLIVMDATFCAMALCDRFLLGWLGGPAILAIYTIAFSLVERPTAMICSAVTTATYPMSIQVLQRDGRAAGGRQAGHNAGFLMTLMLPACAGLALTAPCAAATMVGPSFRAGVAALIPLMCVTALFRGIATHVTDHAFHLAGRPTAALWLYVPLAAVTIAADGMLVPHYGAFAAAWVALFCQLAAVLGGLALGRRIFPIAWPVRESLKILLAVMPMALFLAVATVPPSWAGLAVAVGTGVLIFAASALLLNVAGARTAVLTRLCASRAGRGAC